MVKCRCSKKASRRGGSVAALTSANPGETLLILKTPGVQFKFGVFSKEEARQIENRIEAYKKVESGGRGLAAFILTSFLFAGVAAH